MTSMLVGTTHMGEEEERRRRRRRTRRKKTTTKKRKGERKGQGSTHTTCSCKKTCESAQFVEADELRQIPTTSGKKKFTLVSPSRCKSSSKM